MGTPWRTSENWLEAGEPTFSDGESARIRAGKRVSMARLRAFSASYSASLSSGAASL